MSDHRCTVETLDYDDAADGYILCHRCGRIYKLTPRGWQANPPISVAAARRGKWSRIRNR